MAQIQQGAGNIAQRLSVHDSITKLLQICWLHIHDTIPPHPSEISVKFKKAVWDDLRFGAWCPLHYRGNRYSHEENDMISNSRDPKSPLCHTNISNLMVACRMDMYLNVTAEIETQNRPSSVFLILVSLCKSRLEWDPVWSSAAVAHLLQGLKHDVFKNALLLDLIVTSGYLSYRCPPITFRPFSFELWYQQSIFTQRTAAHFTDSL